MQIARGVVVTSARWLAQQEAAVLVAVLGVLLALLVFLKIAEGLGQGDLANLDLWLLQLLRVPGDPHVPIGPPWLIEAARDITTLGGRTMLLAVILSVVGYLALERKYGAMWLVVVAAGGGGLLSTVMKELFGRTRPDVVPHLVAVTSPSFPSGHSMLAAILYLTLGALLARFATRRRHWVLGIRMCSCGSGPTTSRRSGRMNGPASCGWLTSWPLSGTRRSRSPTPGCSTRPGTTELAAPGRSGQALRYGCGGSRGSR